MRDLKQTKTVDNSVRSKSLKSSAMKQITEALKDISKGVTSTGLYSF